MDVLSSQYNALGNHSWAASLVCSLYEGERCSKGREGSSVGMFGRKQSAGEGGYQNLMFTLGRPNSLVSQIAHVLYWTQTNVKRISPDRSWVTQIF